MDNKLFFKSFPNIKKAPLQNTSGYDIHYAIAEGDKVEDVLKLQALVEKQIRDYKEQHSDECLYISKGNLTTKPVGPWQSKMWEIQISSASNETDPSDPSVVSPDNIHAMHKLMLLIGDYTKIEINQLGLKGSLIIHANIWPMDSNVTLERSMHFDTLWHVCGPKVIFKDIWKTLIAMENALKDNISLREDNWYQDSIFLNQVKANLTEKFKDNEAYPLENGELDRAIQFLIKGQSNLKKMLEAISKIDSDVQGKNTSNQKVLSNIPATPYF